MPFRHTDQGWYWGSRGPFDTLQKAQQVARAAYASGYKEEEQSMSDVSSFAAGLLHGATNLHILHLRASTTAEHLALGDAYETLTEQADEFIEAYQGKYNKIESYGAEYNPPPQSSTEYVIGFIDWLDTYRKTIPQDTYLQNIVDEITQTLASTLNKLRFYK
jgi:hypothetical protein